MFTDMEEHVYITNVHTWINAHVCRDGRSAQVFRSGRAALNVVLEAHELQNKAQETHVRWATIMDGRQPPWWLRTHRRRG